MAVRALLRVHRVRFPAPPAARPLRLEVEPGGLADRLAGASVPRKAGEEGQEPDRIALHLLRDVGAVAAGEIPAARVGVMVVPTADRELRLPQHPRQVMRRVQVAVVAPHAPRPQQEVPHVAVRREPQVDAAAEPAPFRRLIGRPLVEIVPPPVPLEREQLIDRRPHPILPLPQSLLLHT